jgi:hypothetical protein
LTCGRNPWQKASLENSTYRAFIDDRGYLKSILPVSEEVDEILAMIFEPDPNTRITIFELREAVVHCPSFFNESFQGKSQSPNFPRPGPKKKSRTDF